MTLSHGIGIGWLAPTLHTIQSPENTPLSFPVSISEASWIGSLFGLGSLTGNIIFGLLLDRVGRKWCMYLLAMPHMMLWILIFFAKNVAYLYAARFLAGITGGANYIVVPIFISEIADSSIRGALTSMSMLLLSFGILFGYLLSTYLSYYLIPCLVILLSVAYLIAASLFPDTPQYLLKAGKITEAEHAFKFYKNIKGDWNASSEAQKHRVDFVQLQSTMQKGGSISSPVTLKDLGDTRSLKAFFTAFMLIVLNQFSGSFAFVNYMSLIFAESGSTLNPNTCTIIMGVVQITGTCCATVLVDRFGRKLLMLTSAGCMAVCLICFGLFTQFATAEVLMNFNWLPLVIMAILIFVAGFGVIALCFTIIVEILPVRIRTIGTSFSMITMSCMAFASLKLFPLLIYNLGLSITMYSCAGVCVVCFIYLFICLQETKGKNMDFD